jgi:biopolymer transport protein ExbB
MPGSTPAPESISTPAGAPAHPLPSDSVLTPGNALAPENLTAPASALPPGNTLAPSENSFGLEHLWASGDAISHFVAILLLLMSLISWYLVLSKTWDWWRMRRAARCVVGFWAAESVAAGLEKLRAGGIDSPYVQLAIQAHCCNSEMEAVSGRLLSRFDPAEQMERALRQQLQSTQATMENGLTLLATTGATAPFVGLFGTVWGIYHALVAIGISGQAALEKVAGPVGEALIMTAAGLAVALPAVFAYNAFTRVNRVAMADLDAFAHDLHAFFTIGKPFVANSAQIHPLRARLAAGES